jgi:8-oxo-dGTP diphosphatase
MAATWICDLIRHADAGDRELWSGNDRDRPLNERGLSQAEALVDLLDIPPGTLLLSSPARRCHQTLEPISKAAGVSIVTNDLLAEGQDVAPVLELMISEGKRLVICSHGDIIGGLVFDLMSAGLASHTAKFSKASTWRLTCGPLGIAEAEYLPPP